jgi:hypothetical protein
VSNAMLYEISGNHGSVNCWPVCYGLYRKYEIYGFLLKKVGSLKYFRVYITLYLENFQTLLCAFIKHLPSSYNSLVIPVRLFAWKSVSPARRVFIKLRISDCN